MNICLFSTKLRILVKISATITEILTFTKWSSNVYHFQKRTFHEVNSHLHWLLTMPTRLSRCQVMKLQISHYLCNGLQTALILTRWTMQSGKNWRWPPHRATRAGVVQIWPRVTSAAACSYLVVGSMACVCEGRPRTFWTLFMTIDEWSHCFIGDNWTCSPCCHGNLCFSRGLENV